MKLCVRRFVSQVARAQVARSRTWRTSTDSAPSTPPILLISSPHLSIILVISLRCKLGFPGTSLMPSTIAAMTASRTSFIDTLLAIRSVLSSTAAFSKEWSSANARSSDCLASVWNSKFVGGTSCANATEESTSLSPGSSSYASISSLASPNADSLPSSSVHETESRSETSRSDEL